MTDFNESDMDNCYLWTIFNQLNEFSKFNFRDNWKR
jgi:hypothetical protein